MMTCVKEEDIVRVLENPVYHGYDKSKVLASLGITKDYLTEAFEGKERDRKISYLSAPKSNHACGPGIFELSKAANEREILPCTNLVRFEKLLNDITYYIEEKVVDKQNYRIIKGILPDTYFNVVDHIKIKHLPSEFIARWENDEKSGRDRLIYGTDFECHLDKYEIYDYDRKLIRTDTRYNFYCAFARPLPTNVIWPGVDKSDILANYHCIHLKIFSNDIIESWDVGSCLDNQIVSGAEDLYVKLGKYGKHKCIK